MELKFKEGGTDAMYLANINIFFAALFTLGIFQHDWREDKLGSQSLLQKLIDWFRQMFEGGLTGNRLQIAARIAARKDLNGRIRNILRYVAIFGDESDIATLVNSGVVTKKTTTKARKSAKPVVAN